ncbi:MAG: hypothetical protein AB1592_03855 [Pseudomonadota bacterium]
MSVPASETFEVITVYKIMIWSIATGYFVLPSEQKANDCDEAKIKASVALNKIGDEQDLCCHFTEIGCGAFIVWICEEYQFLIEFADTEPGAPLREIIGEIPSPQILGW